VPIPVDLTHPPQRSFKPRRRGLTPSRIEAYERATARWGITVEGTELSLDEVFECQADVVLDVGFGGGEALIELAETRPHEQVIGVDVHTPGVAAVFDAIETRGLRNVRVVEGDVIDFLPRLPALSLAGIRIFFPDPWPKRRQRKRRLVRPDVVDRLVSLLRAGGTIHLATDATDYAAQMARVCENDVGLIGGEIERPSWRPVTRYERRALEDGRRSVDLVYTASESSPRDSSSA
jgi:tRNA (guanine-N7-)-methyltransferase